MMAAKHDQGSTLLLVVWIMSVLGVVASFLLYRAEVEIALVASLENEIKLSQIAQEILHERMVYLGTDETPSDSQFDDWYGGGRIDLERNGYQVTVIISDEGSKPNVNLMNEDTLSQIVPPEYRVNPILDWIDIDDDTRESGAEIAFYELLDPPYKARNGFFSSRLEINQAMDCFEFYDIIESEITVYGKINPNTIDHVTFASMLNSLGFDVLFTERCSMDFQTFKQQPMNRFNEMDDFLRLSSITIETRDKLKPYFHFNGNCNVNMVSSKGLKAWLRKLGLAPELESKIIERRKQQPFEDQNQFESWFVTFIGPIEGKRLGDYFVTYSTIIRYQIWVSKGESKYYLDTVQERTRDDMKDKWRVNLLSWRALFNNEVPKVPEKESETGEQQTGEE